MLLHFDKVASQGELTFTKIDKAPVRKGSVVAAVGGQLIIGHSETGHHHVMDASCATMTRVDEFTAYLNVEKPTQVDHLREHDTHPSIAFQPGMYEIRTGREFDPFEEAIRASAD